MKGKKIYFIEHIPSGAEAKVLIDFDKKFAVGDDFYTTTQAIKMMVEFWSGWQVRLNGNDGNYIDTFLKMLLRNAVPAMAHNFSSTGVKYHFQELEGWFPIDGSCGIKIISTFYPWMQDENDYEIEILAK